MGRFKKHLNEASRININCSCRYLNSTINKYDATNKILISNVCRVTRNAFFDQEKPVAPKPKVSPVYALFDLIRLLVIEKHIFSIYLRVDKHNNAHRANKDSHEALTTGVYPKYGFAIDPGCIAVGYTTMRSDFKTTLHLRTANARRSKTIKRKSRAYPLI